MQIVSPLERRFGVNRKACVCWPPVVSYRAASPESCSTTEIYQHNFNWSYQGEVKIGNWVYSPLQAEFFFFFIVTMSWHEELKESLKAKSLTSTDLGERANISNKSKISFKKLFYCSQGTMSSLCKAASNSSHHKHHLQGMTYKIYL